MEDTAIIDLYWQRSDQEVRQILPPDRPEYLHRP